MKIRLERDGPPSRDESELMVGRRGEAVVTMDADGTRVRVDGRPATSEDLSELGFAFEKGSGIVFGPKQLDKTLEDLAGLPRLSADGWFDTTLPPPMLVAWVAYLRTRPDARAIGHLLQAQLEFEGAGADRAPAAEAKEILTSIRSPTPVGG